MKITSQIWNQNVILSGYYKIRKNIYTYVYIYISFMHITILRVL